MLGFMLQLLHDIAQHAQHNKMTSTNLATIFLPAMFFSVQSDATTPEEIMKMAVIGKAVSATLSFMIDNPSLDPTFMQPSAATVSKGPATIAVGNSRRSTDAPLPNGKTAMGDRRSSSSLSPSPTQDKPRARRGSFSMGSSPKDKSKRSGRESALASSGDIPRVGAPVEGGASGGKLSAEMVLAAMRLAKTRIVRRAGKFGADGSTWTGRRGWLTLGRKRIWCLIVNDWLYWFTEEHREVDNQAALARALGAFAGNLWMARCNVVCKGDRDVYIVQPSGANLVLVADSGDDADSWISALHEICIVGFPLPLHAMPALASRAEWVTVKGQELYAVIDIDKRALLFFRDETRAKVVRSVVLDQATVAKGVVKSKGGVGFVVADAVGRVVVDSHSAGDWVTHLKSAIIVCWALRYEPESVRSLRKV